jgi:hypothetical protein
MLKESIVAEKNKMFEALSLSEEILENIEFNKTPLEISA